MSSPLLFGGVDPAAYGVIVETLDGLVGGPPLQGGDLVVPGRAGAVSVGELLAGPRPIQVGAAVVADDSPTLLADVQAFCQAVYGQGLPYTLTRQLDTSPMQTTAGLARYVSGLSPDRLGAVGARCAFTVLLLDGYFYDTAASTTTTTVTTAGGTVMVGGQARTRRMTLTFTGVSGAWTMVLTNTTTGVSVTLTGSGTTPVVVDVEAFTATQGGANVIGNVAHSGDNYFMVLAPGNNVFTLTGGASVAVAAKAAWL